MNGICFAIVDMTVICVCRHYKDKISQHKPSGLMSTFTSMVSVHLYTYLVKGHFT